MGNICSKDDEGSPTTGKGDGDKKTKKTNAKSNKYAVSTTSDASETSSQEARGVGVNEAGFSVIGDAVASPSAASPTAAQPAISTMPREEETSPSNPFASLSPNPAMAKDSSFKVIPPCANAIIKPNTRNPEDYEANDLTGVTWLRVPGQINDQRINIANCKDCTFILLDQCDSIQIDDCEGCKFYIGPTAGSVFIRSSKQCTVIAACGQLRTRDVFDTKMALFCHSRPVIESSKNVGIGCYPSRFGYHQLLHHMCKSRLSQFTNLWPFVHDFTPSKKAGELNYYILSQHEVEAEDFFPSIASLLPDVLSEDDSAALFQKDAIIPFVACTQAAALIDTPPLNKASLIIFKPGAIEAARAFVSAVDCARRRGAVACVWQLLVEHQFKGPLDGSTVDALSRVGVPASVTSSLGASDFVMGVYSYASEEDASALAALAPIPPANIAFHAPVESSLVSSVCLKLFSDLPTQGKGFGASH